jgi:nucleotide-binding universal stress UspA family protein
VNAPGPAPVVVGIDDTESARRAVRLAATEAVLRGRPLRVVHAHVWPVLRVAPGPPVDGPPDVGLRRRAEAVVESAVAEAARTAPGLPLSGEVIDGVAPNVLLRESRTAALLVVGHRGLRALSGLLVGSVAIQVSAQARCPVLVCRGERERDAGPVVVGVDGTRLSEQAIGFAFEEAALRHAQLIAVHAANGSARADSAAMRESATSTEASATTESSASLGSGVQPLPALDPEHVVADWVAPWRDRFPQVSVTSRVIPGSAARVLIQESGQAQLVVTGALGMGGLTGLVRGSVSQAVLRDSRCPLAIVRQAAAQP